MQIDVEKMEKEISPLSVTPPYARNLIISYKSILQTVLTSLLPKELIQVVALFLDFKLSHQIVSGTIHRFVYPPVNQRGIAQRNWRVIRVISPKYDVLLLRACCGWGLDMILHPGIPSFVPVHAAKFADGFTVARSHRYGSSNLEFGWPKSPVQWTADRDEFAAICHAAEFLQLIRVKNVLPT